MGNLTTSRELWIQRGENKQPRSPPVLTFSLTHKQPIRDLMEGQVEISILKANKQSQGTKSQRAALLGRLVREGLSEQSPGEMRRGGGPGREIGKYKGPGVWRVSTVCVSNRRKGAR